MLTGSAGFPPSKSRIIVRLEKDGLIARTNQYRSPRNTKTIFIATDKGRAALAAAGMQPSGALPSTTDLHETPHSRRRKLELEQSLDPVYQAKMRRIRQTRRDAAAKYTREFKALFPNVVG